MRPMILLFPLACLSTAACQLPPPILSGDYTRLCPISADQPPAQSLLFVTLRVPDCRQPPAILMSAYRAGDPWYGAVDDQLQVTFYRQDQWHAAAASRLRASTSGPPVVFIHGFNNDNRTALGRALAIRKLVASDRPVIAFTWPSYASKSRYIWDEANAEWAGVAARELISTLTSSSPKIMVVAHSMGNRVALDTVRSLKPPTGPSPVERLVMASPDVDRETVVRELKANIGTKVTIYGSRKDQPLSTSWRVHGLPRAGDLSAWVTGSVPDYKALSGITDVEVVDTTDVRADRLGHDDFVSTLEGAADLCRVLDSSLPKSGRADTPYAGVSTLIKNPLVDPVCTTRAASAISGL